MALPVLALFGLADSGYLLWRHLAETSGFCPTGGCDIVNQGQYSEVKGIPIAAFGVGAYLLLFGLSLLVATRISRRTLGAIVAVAGIGAAVSAWLIYLQVAVIESICVVVCPFGLNDDIALYPEPGRDSDDASCEAAGTHDPRSNIAKPTWSLATRVQVSADGLRHVRAARGAVGRTVPPGVGLVGRSCDLTPRSRSPDGVGVPGHAHRIRTSRCDTEVVAGFRAADHRDRRRYPDRRYARYRGPGADDPRQPDVGDHVRPPHS